MTSAPPNGVHSVDRSLEGVLERAVSEDALGSVMLLDHPVSSVAHSPDLSIAPTREYLDTNRGDTLFPVPLQGKDAGEVLLKKLVDQAREGKLSECSVQFLSIRVHCFTVSFGRERARQWCSS